ncbi:hypothetical protein OAQ99_02930 [Candidatus Kapabacteria bacterium]|nr:hypothetical protein [Candidatus Kapabacteria bacterium]
MKQIIGVLFILLGSLTALGYAEIIEFEIWDTVWDWWPIIFLIAGVRQLVTKGSSILGGVLLSIIGIAWIGSNLDLISLSAWDIIIPSCLIILGIFMLTNKNNSSKSSALGEDGFIVVNSLFSGVKERLTINNLTGGKIESVFGGVELDMRNVEFDENFDSLQIDSIFSGVKIWFPENVEVITKGNPILGGLKNSIIPRGDAAERKQIKINFNAIFGGIELLN